MGEMVKAHGRTGADELKRAWADTMGNPSLVTLWLEEARESGHGEGPSIGMLKRFHDRTTHWMSEEQKRWLCHALFLPKVNVETFASSLGSDSARSTAGCRDEWTSRAPTPPPPTSLHAWCTSC
jgi:hypothetical protein